MKNRQMKIIKCKHYKDSGYGAELNEREELRLCDQCYYNLFVDMMKQFAIEHGAQRFSNELFSNNIERLERRIAQLEMKK